uniref:Kynurenine formamidase n=1 Tax=Candidatus Kentrum sp. FW TaxID=2126338 RepID=A0A450TP56_9GAMM|nr:MAG: Kynurenine formamidase [Candidatus Kentron sp. FW]
MKTHITALKISFALVTVTWLAACGVIRDESINNDLYSMIEESTFVDLTHAFDPNIPHWHGFQPSERKTLYTHEQHGFFVEEFTHVGQWGTHVDPPGHFFSGMRLVDDIALEEMVMPLVVIDVHEKVKANPDYQLTMDDIRQWEKTHGSIPKGAFVAMRTDWWKRWPSQEAMMNKDEKGIKHYPGWSLDVLEYLYEEREITASGHEPTDTDPGVSTSKNDYSLEAYILKRNHYQIELMKNLDKVPESGALVIATWPKVKDGSGFPARVFAIVPPRF